jgi:capsular polysaccharide biosynthesis protein
VDVGALNENNPNDKYLLEQFTSYVYKFDKPVMVEPSLAWVITGKFKIFRKSFPYVQDPWDKPKPKPSVAKFLQPKKIKKIDSCISIRYYWQNYYHFFTDTLAQIHLANQHVPMDVPILVPQVFNELRYLKQFKAVSDFLSGREIIVQQKDEYYEVKTLYLCKSTFYSDSIFEVVDSFERVIAKHIPGRERLFLTRAKNRGRNIQNIQEIEKIVSSFGFKTADPDIMSLTEQVELFSNAEMIAGIHGAGFTNIIFRKGRPLKVLEIFPADFKPAHYSNLCRKFNYQYDSITGSDMNGNSFYLDPEQLRTKIAALIAG